MWIDEQSPVEAPRGDTKQAFPSINSEKQTNDSPLSYPIPVQKCPQNTARLHLDKTKYQNKSQEGYKSLGNYYYYWKHNP